MPGREDGGQEKSVGDERELGLREVRKHGSEVGFRRRGWEEGGIELKLQGKEEEREGGGEG